MRSMMETWSPSTQRPANASAPPALPELRLVLLGRKEAGKSAAGNTILGRAGGFESGKPTEECVKIRAEVAGRKVTVVDTPGWEWYYPLNSTPNWVRRETLRSVTLCPPGPHVVLLVVRSRASVTEGYVREIEEHLELLGKGVWDRSMLLFTRADELGLTSMEQRISTGGPALQRLLLRCGGRYHLMNNRYRGDATQVEELMSKLEDMAAGGGFLRVDGALLSGLEGEGKRRARERRKKQRQMEEHMQRATIKAALMSDDPQGPELNAHQSISKVARRLPEVRLVLLGERETGKSSAGNCILGGAGFFQPGVVTEECVRQQAEVARRLVTVVDTPGWEAGRSGGTAERVKREIAASVGLCPPGPHALLLTLRVDTLVVSGHVRDHLELLSEGAWRHALLLFTHGDQLREGVDIQRHVQGGGRDLQWLLERCWGRYHVVRSLDGGEQGKAGVADLLRKVEKMAAMNRCEAFSGLVHEIRVLSHQKNEKFRQRAKEMGDKMLRQEAELRKMREREMKSLRWIFERKKKVKLREQAGVQREEEDEESRSGGRKAEYGELEERIRWLAEDKEREIQDLSLERERIHAALSRSTTERDTATFKLDRKQRELEELHERMEDLQLKALRLECASAEKEEHERKPGEKSLEEAKQEWTGEDTERQEEEKEERVEKRRSLRAEMEESIKQQEDEPRRRTHEANAAETERRLKGETEAELQQAELGRKTQAILIKEEEQKAQEKEKEAEVRTLTLQHGETTGRKLDETRKIQEELEAVQKQHDGEKRDLEQEKERQVAELKRALASEVERQVQAKMREMEERHLAHVGQKASETKDEKERMQRNFRKEMAAKVQEKEREMELLTRQHREEMDRRLKEAEEREERIKETEKVVEELKKEYADEIRGVEEQSQGKIEELRQQFEQETEKVFQERQKMEKYVLELEERVTASEKERDAMIENHNRSMLLRLKERDARVDELKREHVNETRGKMQEFEKERDRIVKTVQEEAEKRETELKLGLSELKQKLQQMEERTTDMEEKQAERSREREVLQARLIDLEHQLRWTAEASEADERHLRKKLREKDETIQAFNRRLADTNGSPRREDEEEAVKRREEVERRLRGRERELEEMAQQLLKEREEWAEAKWRDEQRREEEEEVNVVKELMEQKTREMAEAQQLLAKGEKEMEEVKTQCASYLTAVKEAEERCQQQHVALLCLRQSHAEQLRRKDAEVTEKVREGQEERRRLRRENGAKEKELALLRLRIEQTKAELKDVGRRMETEMTGMIRGYEKEIEIKNQALATLAKEKERAVEKYDGRRRRVEELGEENEKMRKEAESLRLKLRRAVEKEASGRRQRAESRGADVKEKDAAIGRLEEARDRLPGELHTTAERRGEAKREIQGLQEDFELKPSEKRRQFRAEEEEISKPEREVAEREKACGRTEEAPSKRGCELVRKEEDVDRGPASENKAHQLSGTQGLSDRWREERRKRRDEQRSVRDGERQKPGERADAVPWRLCGTAGDLKELKEEKNQGVREDSLEFAVADWPLARGETEEGEELVDQPAGLVLERGEGTKEKEDWRAMTAAGRSSGGAERAKVTRAEAKEGKEGTDAQGKKAKNPSQAKVTGDPRFLWAGRGRRTSNANEGSRGSDLRVMVLGEAWSPHAPDGVTVLCGEPSEQDGSTVRRWRGRVAGRRLSVVEPLGLKWRNGPGPDKEEQRRRLLDGARQCRPGPHVVLLLLPAFLTCTRRLRSALEEHMSWLGPEVWRRALLLFTWGEMLGESAEQHVLRNRELLELVAKCGGRYHVVTSNKNNSLVEGLLEKLEDIVATNTF